MAKIVAVPNEISMLRRAAVERADVLWILVPPSEHRDVDGALCDFVSWRSRGWCRMEAQCRALSC